MENNDNLISVLKTIFKWKKYIIYTCLAVAVGTVITVLVVPVYYKATTIFYAASPDLADPSLLYGGSNNGMRYYGDKDDIDRIMSIAQSGELADLLIKEFDLYNHYDIDTSHRLAKYYVYTELSSLFEAERTKEDAIKLTVEDTDKALATRMANFARDKINEIAQRLIKESLARTAETYRQSLEESRKKLDSLGKELRMVRDSFGVYNTETQSEGMVTLVTKTEAKIQRNKAKLEFYKSLNQRAYRDSIVRIQSLIPALEAELETYRTNLERFNKGFSRAEVLTQVQLRSSDQLGKDRERYRQLLSVYNSSFPAIHVLEEATIPVVKSRPKRMLIVTVAVVLAFILSVIGVLIFDTYRDINWRDIYSGKN
ncbi:MAG: hypothetical protein D6714_03580 [Bacteroidetes bacterium]|nr:MAG: hypothetical protein D6714_03580 [Bacteroidota bacterium]